LGGKKKQKKQKRLWFQVICIESRVHTGKDFGRTDKDGSFAKVFLHSYSKISSLSTVGSLQRVFSKILEQPKITMKLQSNLHDLQQSSKPTSTYVHEG
jgi:hypothetical protein